MHSSSKSGQLTVLQITDMHLFADPKKSLLGVNTEQTFLATLQQAASENSSPDLIILTGDISQDSSTKAYLRLVKHLDIFDAPCFTLPGNHDIPKILSDSLNNAPSISQQAFYHTEHWLFAFLDSATPNEEGGTLKEQEISALKTAVHSHPEKNVLICLHHQLLNIDSEWLDTMTVANPQPLISLIETSPNIKGLIHGHIHQAYEYEIKGTPVYAAPSTCFQFKPYSKEFALDDIAPGYRWLSLDNKGGITTQVRRIKEKPSNLETSSTGY